MVKKSKFGQRPAATTLVPYIGRELLETNKRPPLPPLQGRWFLNLSGEMRNEVYKLACTLSEDTLDFSPGARIIPNISLGQTGQATRAEYSFFSHGLREQWWTTRFLSPPSDTGPRGLELYLAPTFSGQAALDPLATDVQDRFDYILLYCGSRQDRAPRPAGHSIVPRAIFVHRPFGREPGKETPMVPGDTKNGSVEAFERKVRKEIEANGGSGAYGWTGDGEVFRRRFVFRKLLWEFDRVYGLLRPSKAR